MDKRENFDPHAERRCCCCSKNRHDVRNIVCLDKKAPEPGTGWGCVVCDLGPEGALALICDPCANPSDPQDAPEIRYAYHGFAGAPHAELIGTQYLKGRHEHNIEKHTLDDRDYAAMREDLN